MAFGQCHLRSRSVPNRIPVGFLSKIVMLDYTRQSASNPLRALKSLRKLGQGDRDERDHMRKKEQKRKKKF